jgi:hypothetical protein
MAILNNSNAISSGGYDINNSLRFRSSASAYLNRTPGSAGNQQIFTWSGWVKRGQLSSEQAIIVCRTGSNAAFGRLVFTSGDVLQFFARNSSSTTTALLNTTQVFRDPSAWYHIVLAVDTTQATAANRIKFYVNGTQITAFSTATYPSQNTNLDFNTTADTYIGVEIPNAIYFDGYMAEVNFVNAQQLTPSSFGETDATTGQWLPKAYTGTYGTNGYYLKFSDIATTSGSNAGLGKDFSGNANYWTTNNISVTAGTTYDAMIDSPTLTSATVANYATLNPLSNLDGHTLAGANLNFTQTTNASSIFGTMGVSSGKWYWEVICYDGVMAGVADTQRSSGTYPGNFANSCGWNTYYTLNSTNTYASGTFSKAGTISGSAGTNGQVIGVALDMDAGTIVYYINGSVQNSGNAVFTGITGTVFPLFRGSTTTSSVNFGQRPFSYTPPTGYVRLNTFNLPDSTIKKGSSYMDAILYTGNGTNGRAITTGMATDFVWVKKRSASDNHELDDKVRGAAKRLSSNSTSAETAISAIASFTSTGFTVDGWGTTNENGYTYVAWSWLANGSGSTNTAGSITSTVSANTTAGFSIVTYTGTGSAASIGHGLGVTPEFIIVKRRDTTSNWMVVSKYLSNYNWYLKLNLTDAQVGDATIGNIDPSPTTFNVGTNAIDNASGGTYVAYVFAPIAGFSKFTSYTGNGSADGPFVYLGFRPKFVMIKRTDTTGSWAIEDTARDSYNQAITALYPNQSIAETTIYDYRDFLSNGFKLRTSDSNTNASGGTYIVAAWAENPFKNSNAR